MPGDRIQVHMLCPWGCCEELLPFLVPGGTAGGLLRKRKTLPPSMLLQYQAGSRQQDVAKKPSAR